MMFVYVVRFGPALGDDYSCQVFTQKADMLAFVKELQDANTAEAAARADGMSRGRSEEYFEFDYEVHFVELDKKPNIKDEDDKNYSQLILIGAYPDTIIWRVDTAEHQSL